MAMVNLLMTEPCVRLPGGLGRDMAFMMPFERLRRERQGVLSGKTCSPGILKLSDDHGIMLIM